MKVLSAALLAVGTIGMMTDTPPRNIYGVENRDRIDTRKTLTPADIERKQKILFGNQNTIKPQNTINASNKAYSYASTSNDNKATHYNVPNKTANHQNKTPAYKKPSTNANTVPKQAKLTQNEAASKIQRLYKDTIKKANLIKANPFPREEVEKQIDAQIEMNNFMKKMTGSIEQLANGNTEGLKSLVTEVFGKVQEAQKSVKAENKKQALEKDVMNLEIKKVEQEMTKKLAEPLSADVQGLFKQLSQQMKNVKPEAAINKDEALKKAETQYKANIEKIVEAKKQAKEIEAAVKDMSNAFEKMQKDAEEAAKKQEQKMQENVAKAITDLEALKSKDQKAYANEKLQKLSDEEHNKLVELNFLEKYLEKPSLENINNQIKGLKMLQPPTKAEIEAQEAEKKAAMEKQKQEINDQIKELNSMKTMSIDAYRQNQASKMRKMINKNFFKELEGVKDIKKPTAEEMDASMELSQMLNKAKAIKDEDMKELEAKMELIKECADDACYQDIVKSEMREQHLKSLKSIKETVSKVKKPTNEEIETIIKFLKSSVPRTEQELESEYINELEAMKTKYEQELRNVD